MACVRADGVTKSAFIAPVEWKKLAFNFLSKGRAIRSSSSAVERRLHGGLVYITGPGCFQLEVPLIPMQLHWREHSYVFHWVFFVPVVFPAALQGLFNVDLLSASRGCCFPPHVLCCCHLDWVLLFYSEAAEQLGLSFSL